MNIKDIFRALTRSLSMIFMFKGRESRAQFWPLAIFLMLAGTLIMQATMLPAMIDSFGKMEQFANAHPEQATRHYGPGSYHLEIKGEHPNFMPDLDGFFAMSALFTIIMICCLAAAVTRRLHDTGRRGWWGLIPLPFLASGFWLFPDVMTLVQAPHDKLPDNFGSMFALLFINNVAYIASVITLLVLLCLPGDKNANRFGPPSLPSS